MADKIKDDSKYIPQSGIGMAIDEFTQKIEMSRQSYTRKWYDNNFFDDGYHFRYVSRTTGKVIDQATSSRLNIPERAIPKASRQIRGIANLLLGPEYRPVIYPEKVNADPRMDPQGYAMQLETSKTVAKRIGQWVTDKWDELNLFGHIVYMVILAAKNSISYLQVWSDNIEEKIKVKVFDAFDLYLVGELTDIEDQPMIVKAAPMLISKIKANEAFDKKQVEQIHPDNKYASSEIKSAYMQSKYGMSTAVESTQTLILKEAFIKEYLNESNQEVIEKQNARLLKNKKIGDMIMRHTFSAGGVWLLDEYVDLPGYPFVDFRFEPGPMYQTSLIERFIPTNKTLDAVVSRIERYIGSMITGTWLVRKGEDMVITNIAGGQKIEYEGNIPVQGQMASIPQFVFNFINVLNSIIEEQGASTSTLGVLPSGVKSGVAIEALKSTEYANLKIASSQIKDTVKRITQKMLYYASDFVEPETVFNLDDGEPDYFDVMGQNGIDTRKILGEDTSMYVPIKRDYKVKIEVESGLGFTMEGKKQTMQQIITFFVPLIQQGLIGTDALKVLIQKTLETYQFGATQELVEGIESGIQTSQMSEDQITQMKVAMAEVLKDAGVAGSGQEEQQINTTKVGVAEALADLTGGGLNG